MIMNVCVMSDIPRLFPAVVRRCKDLGGVHFTRPDLGGASETTISSQLQQADIVVWEPARIAEHMSSLSSVRWVHSTWAGVNELVSLPSRPLFLLTRHGDGFGQLMAEYVVAQAVNWERRLFRAHDDQKKRRWDSSNLAREYRFLSSLTIGILGVGNIGRRIAEVCKVLGMTVWGLTRSLVTDGTRSPHVDQYRQLDGLPELLSSSDYVCNVLPSTAQTRGLLDGDILRHCADKKSVFINVGRGDIVSDATLIHSIQQGWLAGTILDVFENEPLPTDSKLWSMPEVVVTPHCAAVTPVEEAAELFVQNLRLYLAGKPLEYVVDWDKGY